MENKNFLLSGLRRIVWLGTGAKEDRGPVIHYCCHLFFIHILNCKRVNPDSVSKHGTGCFTPGLSFAPRYQKANMISSHMHRLKKRDTDLQSQAYSMLVNNNLQFCILSLSCSGGEQIATLSSPALVIEALRPTINLSLVQ